MSDHAQTGDTDDRYRKEKKPAMDVELYKGRVDLPEEFVPETALERLSKRRGSLAATAKAQQDEIDKLLKPLEKKIKQIKDKYKPKLEEIAAKLGLLENQLRTYVLDSKETLEGEDFQVQYVRPSIKANTERLMGMAAAHPFILEALTECESTPKIVARKE